jgi:hypothetical protein
MSVASRIVRRNPFAYPGGLPGLDLTHPAAAGLSNGLGFSAVWLANGTFVDLVAGLSFTAISSSLPTKSTLGALGPCGLVNATTQPVQTSGQSMLTPTALTMAAIVQFAGAGDGNTNTVISTNNASGHFNQFGRAPSSSNFQYFYNNAVIASNYVLSTGIPYFIATSVLSSSKVNHVATNLLTGQIFSTATTTSTTLGASSASPRIGEDFGSGHYAAAYIAAAMMSVKFMPMPALLAWAADPWSFWYPQKVQNVMFSALRGSLGFKRSFGTLVGV